SCFSSPRVLLHLHSFPTRRSSDLREVVTVSPYDRLEDAIYLMMKNHVGILPVVENNRVHGIITDKDVFKAFLEISGYGEEGVRVITSADDTVGTLAKITATTSAANPHIRRTMVATRKSDTAAREIQLDGKLTPPP